MAYCSFKDFHALIRAEYHSGTRGEPFSVYDVIETARTKGYQLTKEKALTYISRLIEKKWVIQDGEFFKNVLWVYEPKRRNS